MVTRTALVALLLVAFPAALVSATEDADFEAEEPVTHGESTTFVVEHSFGAGFSPRSEVALHLSKQDKSITAKIVEPTYRFTDSEVAQFSELVKSDGFYSVRVATKTSYVLASVRACALQRDWHEIINYHVDKDGELLAMDFAAPYDQRPCGGVDITGGMQQLKLTSMAKLKLPHDAPPVPTFTGPAPGMPKPAGAKKVEGKEGEEPAQSQSFIRRYWYIILPVVLLSMLQSPEPEEGKGGGGAVAKGGGKKKN